MEARVQGPAGAIIAVAEEVAHTGTAHEAVAATPPVGDPHDVHSEVKNAVTWGEVSMMGSSLINIA